MTNKYPWPYPKGNFFASPAFFLSLIFSINHFTFGLVGLPDSQHDTLSAQGEGRQTQLERACRQTMTQKVIRAYGQNQFDETVCVRRCSDPDAAASVLYADLNYQFCPFVRRKFVVRKPILRNEKNEYLQAFSSG
ncbi:MAG: hypothetical protein CRN43_00145 [Candidatus Nephrothrix sp. EaCA]|nr:MAG: hypothetical protein CRN43_00145 [Candidatus Nephrothrix sp. EaCA]